MQALAARGYKIALYNKYSSISGFQNLALPSSATVRLLLSLIFLLWKRINHVTVSLYFGFIKILSYWVLPILRYFPLNFKKAILAIFT